MGKVINNKFSKINASMNVNSTYQKDYFDYQKDVFNLKVDSEWEYSFANYKVYKMLEDGTYSKEPTDVWLLDIKKSYDDVIQKKKIVIKPDQNLNMGDIIKVPKWNNDNWLITTMNPAVDYYNSGQATRCNHIFEFQNKSGKSITIPCVLQAKNPYSSGVKEYPEIILGDTQRYMEVSNTIYTKEISRNMEYEIDGLNYKITSIDRTTRPDICAIVFTEYQMGSKTDNVFTIDLQENSLELKVNDTKQLNVIVKRDSDIVKRDIIYKSSDETIATVDINGLITCVKNGNVVINAILKDNSDVKDECKLVVIDVPIPQNVISYDFDVNSKNFVIGFGVEKTFYFDKYENGNKTNYGSFAYELDYNGKDSKIASITNHESNKVIIRTNNKMISGKIYLVIKDTLNGNNVVTRQELNIKWV